MNYIEILDGSAQPRFIIDIVSNMLIIYIYYLYFTPPPPEYLRSQALILRVAISVCL